MINLFKSCHHVTINMEEAHIECCVRGYHVYSEIWEAVLGETLSCRREPTNVSDRYAVAVLKDDITVGHLPRKFTKIFSLFFRGGGSITCQVTGHRRYSRDLAQGGMEIPCELTLRGAKTDIKKFRALIDNKKSTKQRIN